jgi:hypothetical protein
MTKCSLRQLKSLNNMQMALCASLIVVLFWLGMIG